MVVVDDRSMTNVCVIDNRSLWSLIGRLHALISSHIVCKQIVAHDPDFEYRKLDDFQTKQRKLEVNQPFFQ